MRIAFFHGLESPAVSDKTEWLHKNFDYVYAPPMEYTDSGLFDKVLTEVKAQGIELLTGSSMGGWFAYCISTLTGIPAVLFNPAVHGRSMEPSVKMGNASAIHTVVLGKGDDVIDPYETVKWFKKNGVGNQKFKWESNGHRTPINIFTKYLRGSINESHVMLFEQWVNEKRNSGKYKKDYEAL